MHPVTAVFAVLLILGTFHLPPYLVNAEHGFLMGTARAHVLGRKEGLKWLLQLSSVRG